MDKTGVNKITLWTSVWSWEEVCASREWVFSCTRSCVLGTEERYVGYCSNASHLIIHEICRGEGEHQWQQLSLFRSLGQCFLTHSSNWRPWCWQQRSTSWQHQASGGVEQHVGQRDMMSDESRAELCQSSRGEKQDITSDDYEQCRVRGWNHTGRKGWKPNGLEAEGVEEGQRKKYEGHW